MVAQGENLELELVRAYYNIEDANVRKGVYLLIKGVGADAGKDS